MHIGPQEARTYLSTFLGQYSERPDRQVWFFPPAVSLEAVATIVAKRLDLLAGAQDIYWEPKGAYTGAISGPLAALAGARATLIGHSERRHVFGETYEQTGKKLAAPVRAGLHPVPSFGQALAPRDAGGTLTVATHPPETAFGARL